LLGESEYSSSKIEALETAKKKKKGKLGDFVENDSNDFD
jgi:hypothetical protein